MRAQVIYTLDERVHRHFVFMMTVVLIARGRNGVAFIDDEKRASVLSGRLHDLVKSLGQQRAHLTDLAATSNAIAQSEQLRVLGL